MQQEQRPVHFNSAFWQGQRLVEHPDLQPQLTFSRIPSGAAALVIHLILTCPLFTSQPNSLIEGQGGDITGWSALFHMRHWYDARFVGTKRNVNKTLCLSKSRIVVYCSLFLLRLHKFSWPEYRRERFIRWWRWWWPIIRTWWRRHWIQWHIWRTMIVMHVVIICAVQ